MNKAMKRKSIILASVACAVLAGSAVGALGMNFDYEIQASAETTTLTQQSFVMPGASVRIATDKNGIRFPVWLPVSVYEANKEAIIESGTLLCPKAMYDETQLTVEAYKNATSKTDGAVTTEKWVKTTDPKTGTEYYQSMIYLYNIPSTDMETEIMARGYVKTATETLYSPIITRSMAEVAYQAMQDPDYASHATTLQGYLGNYVVELDAQENAFEVYDSVSVANKVATLSANNLTIDLSSYATTITETSQVAVVVNGERTVLDSQYVSVEEKVVTIDGAAFGSSIYGDAKLQIVTDNNAFETSLNIITKKIANKTDLENMVWYGGMDATATGMPYDGYFVLTDNIDCANTVLAYRSNNDYATPINYSYAGNYGFAGIFDGKGYKIYNMLLSDYSYGVFGNTQKDSVIKNVAFCGTQKLTSDVGTGQLIGRGISGKLTNCYVDFTTDASSKLENGYYLLGQSLAYSQLSDVVIKYKSNAPETGTGFVRCYLGNYPGVFDGSLTHTDWVKFNNVYVFTDSQFGYRNLWTNTSQSPSKEVIMSGTTVNAYDASIDPITVEDSTYWTLKGDQPVFKSVSPIATKTIAYTGTTYQATAFETFNDSGWNGTKTPGANTFQVDLSAYELPANPTSIKLVSDRATKIVDSSCFNNGILTISNVGANIYGEVSIEFTDEETVYKVSSFNIVTKYINKVADLANMIWYGGLDANLNVAGKPYDGYFVLTTDLDCDNTTLTYRDTNSYFTQPSHYNAYDGKNGFAGIFDGQGHKIYNMNLGNGTYGVFGNTQIGSEIRNVAFYGTQSWGTVEYSAYLLGYGVSSKITNCYVDVTNTMNYSSNTSGYLLGITCAYMEMQDVVLKHNVTGTSAWVAAYLGLAPGTSLSGTTWLNIAKFDNVYAFAFSTNNLSRGWRESWDNTQTSCTITENAYDATVTGVTMTDDTYWDLTGTQPVWKGVTA